MKKVCHPLSIMFMLFIVFKVSTVNAQGGVAINAAGTQPDSSAILDIGSSSKGLLIPRMSTSQRNAISKPATGLEIFNTDCNVYNFNAGTPSVPNWVTSNSSNALVASVSIAASPVGAICSGADVTFTATPSSGINSPTYQWKVNGGNVGTNSSSYSNSNLNNGDVVNCILTTSEACVTGSPATSNSISMTVTPIPSTPGSISGSTGVCTGSTGNIYSVSPVAGATSYNWTVPQDAAIASGAGNTSINVTFGLDSGTISVTAVNSCGSSSASTQTITINPPAPGTPGNISGSSSAASGSSGNVYSISAVNNATTYTWSVPSDATITAGQGTTSITVTFGTNSGNIAVTAGNSCSNSFSSTLAITVCNGYNTGNQTFNYTGSMQIFTVPSCVSAITIAAYGAAGQNSVAAGGQGGYATGTLAVSPGQTLYIFVGGQSGWNGGGPHGPNGGGYGGDASDVRAGGTALMDRVIVAGGGGGGAGNDSSYGAGPGGNGGGLTGDMGGNSAGCGSCYYGGGGGGGTQNSGGAAGWGGCNACYGACGYAGTLGVGGEGSSADHPVGGGGGGGYYGGGGGGSDCSCGGGGGGSSYITGLTNASTSTGGTTGNGQIVFTW